MASTVIFPLCINGLRERRARGEREAGARRARSEREAKEACTRFSAHNVPRSAFRMLSGCSMTVPERRVTLVGIEDEAAGRAGLDHGQGDLGQDALQQHRWNPR